MTTQQIRIQVLEEILGDLGISATLEQLEQISMDFSGHLEMEGEMDSYQHFSFEKEPCNKCKLLQDKLNISEKEKEIYRTSIKEKNNTETVWINDGLIIYDGR